MGIFDKLLGKGGKNKDKISCEVDKPNIRCSLCGKKIKYIENPMVDGSATLIGGSLDSFDQWAGNVCLNCKMVLCSRCIDIGRSSPCPNCGQPTNPAFKNYLEQIGMIKMSSERLTERMIEIGNDILELMSRRDWKHIEIIMALQVFLASFCKDMEEREIEEFKGLIRNQINEFEQLETWPFSATRELRIKGLNLKAEQMIEVNMDRAVDIKLSIIEEFEKKYELGEFMTVLQSLFAFYLSRIPDKEEQEKLLDLFKFLRKQV